MRPGQPEDQPGGTTSRPRSDAEGRGEQDRTAPAWVQAERLHREVTHSGAGFPWGLLLVVGVAALTLWAALSLYRAPAPRPGPRPARRSEDVDRRVLRDAVYRALRSGPLKADSAEAPGSRREGDAPAQGIRAATGPPGR